MKEIIEELFGVYEPVLAENIEGNPVNIGLGSVDFAWLAGVFLFGLCLYCLFRLLGGIFRR